MAHPNRRSTRQRTDTTHPEPPRPAGRRGGDRRAWPTAPTTTRVSPAKPAERTRHKAVASPTPVTVWTATDRDKPWSESVVERVVTSFSEPGAHVVLLSWPNHDAGSACLLPTVTEVHPDHVSDKVSATDLAATAHVVNRLGRSATDQAHGSADLVITSMCPSRSEGTELALEADSVALFAARLLRVGGVLAVLTHCDWSSGELTDPTGLLVTAGQAADLLYLQHVIVVRARANDGRLEVLNGQRGTCDRWGDAESRTRHRALVRGLPAPHRRIHVDLLVFAQPHDHRLSADSLEERR